MSNKIYLSGAIDQSGEFRIFEKNEYTHFLSQNKGVRITICIEASEHNRKLAYFKYYWGVLIPRIAKGYKNTGVIISCEGAEMEMRKMCCLYEETPKADGTGYDKRLRSIKELNDAELYDYMELVKIISAEYLNIYIDDPITF